MGRGRIIRGWNPRRAIGLSGLSATEKLILSCYDAHAPDMGEGSSPSVETLMDFASSSRASIYRYVKKLREDGLLIRLEEPGPRNPPKYAIDLRKLARLAQDRGVNLGPNAPRTKGSQPETPQNGGGVSEGGGRGLTGETGGVSRSETRSRTSADYKPDGAHAQNNTTRLDRDYEEAPPGTMKRGMLAAALGMAAPELAEEYKRRHEAPPEPEEE